MPSDNAFLEALSQLRWLPRRELNPLLHTYREDALGLACALAKKFPQHIDSIGKCWGDSINVAYVSPTKSLVQYDVVRRIPRSLAESLGVLPIYEMNYVITVASATPQDIHVQHELQDRLGTHVSMVFSFPHQIQSVLEIAYMDVDELAAILSIDDSSGDERMVFGQLGKLADERAVIQFTRGLLLLAVRNRASDIHIEPSDEEVRIRFRQDGILQEVLRVDMETLAPLVNHIKILAGVDIAESRRPQDGRISVPIGGRDLDIRFSCIPTVNGSKVVLRLLGQNAFAAVPDLEELNFSKQVLSDVVKILSAPNGIFFITGPTGSGKTTTLFAGLKKLNQTGINIVTVEDPVEYRMPGLNQMQVDPSVNVSFASALRAFLRQDPDVILVGEIRDQETAKIAAQAALTGHLVMATMHTNSALQAITRLIQIGVEPFLVAPSLIGVMAQRLVRRLCDHCKKRRVLEREEIEKYFIWDGETEVAFYQPVGCDRCNGTGYSGRIAIHEMYVIDEDTRELIAKHASILDISRHAYESGFQPLRYDGFKKVLRGLTTAEEIDRVMIDFEVGLST